VTTDSDDLFMEFVCPSLLILLAFVFPFIHKNFVSDDTPPKLAGRPPLPRNERRTYLVKVLMNEAEMSEVQELRRRERKPESQLGREALLAMARKAGIQR
jgi:hypothetical protein